MSRRAGVVTVNFNAGTAKFIADTEKAKAKVREFGSHSVSSVQAASGAIRTFEGNVQNNVRAVERFLVNTLKLGPVLQAAFPLVGAIAFGGLIYKLGEEVYDFFKRVQDAPEKIKGAFRELNAPLRATNDELRVANDRLENDIAKLEGRRQNTLKLALDEARVSADKLADSLDKDLSALNKVLTEQNINAFTAFFTGTGATSDLKKYFGGETGLGGFTGRVAAATSAGEESIGAAKTLEEKNAARKERDAAIARIYAEAQAFVRGELSTAIEAQKPKTKTVTGRNGELYEQTMQGPDQTARIELLKSLQRGLREQAALPGLLGYQEDLTGKKQGLDAAKDAAALTRPYEDRIKALDAQLESVRAKMATAGLGEQGQVMAKAYGEAVRAIEEVNKSLEEHHLKLTDAQMGQITLRAVEIQQTEAEAEWRKTLASTNSQIADRIRSQELLTAAIGKGYDATKRANVESQVMQALGTKYNDRQWMTSHLGDVQALRSQFGAAFDAAHANQTASAVDKLETQIELEKSLAAVQEQGAEAVQRVTLAYRLRDLVANGATREQIASEIALFNAGRANASAASVASLNAKLAAVRAITAAQIDGADAARQAGLDAKYAEMQRNGANPQEIAASRQLDTAEHQQQITQEALRTGMAYKDQLESIDQQIDALKQLRAAQGETLEVEISLRDLENQRLHTMAQQALQMRGAKDGLRAFFLDMQADAKSAANIVYDTLHSALDRVSDQFANLLTGQKTDFGKMFKDLGHQYVADTVKSGLQRGLGALGAKLGITATKADGSAQSPFYVRVVGGPSMSLPGSGTIHDIGGLFGGGSKGGGIFSLLGLPFGGARAEGGPVAPGQAYVVGERGPEILFSGSGGYVASNAAMRRTDGGGSVVYNVDARGSTDPHLTREFVLQGLRATHNSAVATAVRATALRAQRVPVGR